MPFNVRLYILDPISVFSTTVNTTSTWTGSSTYDGDAVITDPETGIGGQYLDDDNAGGELAQADVTIGLDSSDNANVDAESVWTVRDTITGQTFQIARFEVESGDALGYYTLSEKPLVNGRQYDIVEYDSNPNANAGDPAFNFDQFSDGIVSGTAGDDVIDGSYDLDPHGDMVDGSDAATASPVQLDLNWSDFGDEANLANNVTQDTGGIGVSVAYTNNGALNPEFTAEANNNIYVGSGEPFSGNSSAYLYGAGSSDNSTIEISFAAQSASGFEDEVQNAQFRINDIDGLLQGGNNFQDIVSIRAYDANGVAVPVSITISGDDSFSDESIEAGTFDTVVGSLVNASESNIEGSILVTIAGPLSSIEIDYDNGGNTQQAIYISDVHFEAIPFGAEVDLIEAGDGNDFVDSGLGDDTVFGGTGNDSITGGTGADVLDGGTGNDLLNVGSGDTATGGDGDDVFIIDDTALDGTALSITGGEGAETVGDTLDFNGQLQAGSLNIVDPDTNPGGMSGTATLLDGTVVTFSNIEAIICFTPGTLILTMQGEKPIEMLQPGDMLLTRDNGYQPLRWIGNSTVDGTGHLAPIEIEASSRLGTSRPLLVSPQHRMLIKDHHAELLFGANEVFIAATHLLDEVNVRKRPAKTVTYIHLMLDQHEVIYSNGAATESFHPAPIGLSAITDKARHEMFRAFPELRSDVGSYGDTARRCLKGYEAKVLLAQLRPGLDMRVTEPKHSQAA